ncbi:MAG: M2 family metallopeptidase, partial [Gammaproteobacteria bacterium]
MSKRPALVLALAVLALVAACSRSPQEGGQSAAAKPTPAEAKQFVARVNRHLAGLARYDSRAQWVKSTYITDDTEALAARADDAYLAYLSKAVKEAQKYADVDGLDSDTRRQLKLLKLNVPAPAPDDPEKRHELTTIAARMEGMYGKGKYCTDPDKPETCKTLNDLTRIMAESRDYDTLLDAWTGWRTVSPPMRDDYTRFVTLANQGARSLGYSDLSEMWKDGYDMDPAAFERDTDHLWKQVKPLYTQLQCYVRGRLADHYGERHFSDGMIPAHLLGNMWAQEWANIYPLVEPYPDTAQVNVTAGLKAQNYDARRMVKSAENYYQSMDLGTLPDTFWQRSMLTKPRDREVVC